MGKRNDSPVDEWLSEDNLILLEAWARDGFTMEEIANKMGVARSSLSRWRKEFPQIQEALRKGKEVVDYMVENALLKSALGFRYTETKTYISYPDKNGNRKTRKEVTETYIAPNVTACMAWLNNRKPDQWKRNRDNVLTTEDKDNNITINIIKKGSDTEDNEDWDVQEPKTKKKEPLKKAGEAQEHKGAKKVEYSDEELEWLNG